MRSHAKASTAGSTQRQAGRLGRFIRGAFAGRGDSSDAKGSDAPADRRIVIPVGVLLALLAFMAQGVGSASAAKTHLFKETFGSAAQPSFGSARGIAVDQSTGDLLVMDADTNTINRYNADGSPDSFAVLGTNVIDGQGSGDETPQGSLGFASPSESQIAVDNSGGATDGNIYVTQGSPNLINIFSEDGEYLGQLTAAGATSLSEACGVTVDPSGAVYVGDYSGGIRKFVPAANPPVNADNTATFSSVVQPCTLAAGVGPSAGFLFAAQYNGPISKLDSSSGELKYTISPDSHVTLTVDSASGNVFAATNGKAIKEFDASGAGSATSVSITPLPSIGQGVATNSSGDILISRFSGPNVLTYDAPVVAFPDVVTSSATNVNQTIATLNGTVNPDGVALEECRFEYGTSTSYGQSVPCAESTGSIGAGTSPVPVHADIGGLSNSTIHHFRLVAKNANPPVQGGDESFETSSKPVIKEQWAEGVVRTEAILKAKINPKGLATTYHIEYGIDTSYSNSTADVGIGSDSADHIVTKAFEGLAPDSTYHYRFVATNEVGTQQGADHTFTTYALFAPDTNCANQQVRVGAAINLADCRGYEMVSPLDKNGGDIRTNCTVGCERAAFVQATREGDKLTYSSATSFGDQASSLYSNQYLSNRGPSGWSTHGINAPVGRTIFDPAFPGVEFNTEFFAFSDDLSSAYLRSYGKTPLTPDALSGYANLYRRDNTDGSLEALTVNYPLDPPLEFFENALGGSQSPLEVLGVSLDENHVIYGTAARLIPDAAPGGSGSISRQLYDFTDGELQLVSVLPGGEASSTFSNLGSDRTRFEASRDNAVSDDGSRIFWSAGSGSGRDLYVRIDGETTVPISSDGTFWTATPEGSKVLYSEGSVPTGEGNLIKYDVDSDTRTPIAGMAYGVLGTSDDLSHVYFVSKEVLSAGATAGQPNLYVDQEGTTSFIATVTNQDVVMFSNGPPSRTSIASSSPINRSARVTPDGRSVAFTSHASLTGYDNTDTTHEVPAMEVYTYDADTDELICASCNPSGARPTTGAMQIPFMVGDWPVETPGSSTALQWAAAWLTTSGSANHIPRALSDDGSRLFFNSFDALVPEDTNGAQDVYEWEAQDSGTCEEAGGCISLISTGESPKRSEFVDAGADGRDVFFETEGDIYPGDVSLVDIYDAREGGGYPTPPSPTPCVGDACQSVPPAPSNPSPASASFKGAGDPKPRKARPRCRARNRKAVKGSKTAKRKAAKRCSRAKRGAAR